MSKPELVLSNTTTFFSGKIENTFKLARKHGFKYLELIPYRWTRPEQILALEKKYGVRVIGIHMPPWWKDDFWLAFKTQLGLLAKILSFLWQIYLGSGQSNPALKIAKLFREQNRDFYLLFHENSAAETGTEFPKLAGQFPILIENLPYQDPIAIKTQFPGIGIVFDPGHFETILHPFKKILEVYQQLQPQIIHISYSNGNIHTLPNPRQTEELKQMLQIHPPKYIVLETNPLVNVKRGKQILEKIID